MPKFSIIIPTFNDDKYIKGCIDSILDSDFDDYEIIIVIDGSTDDTVAILNSYILNDKITIIYQENSGAGKARNNGIDKSSGEYILFVDADDFLSPNALSVYNKILSTKEYDWIYTNAISFNENTKSETIIGHNRSFFIEKDDVPGEFLKLYFDNSSLAPWGKLYKASIIKNNHLRFPDLRRSQDIVFNNTYVRYVHSIYVSDIITYRFRNTLSEKKTYKDIKSRRNDYRFIEAQRNHLKTIIIVFESLNDTLLSFGYECSLKEKEELNNSFLLSVYNSFSNISKRGRSFVFELLKNAKQDEKIIHKVKSARPSKFHLKLFKYFFLKRQKRLLALMFSFDNNFHSLLKKVFK